MEHERFTYKNHLKECPVCGAKLKRSDVECPACGINLVGYNDEQNRAENLERTATEITEIADEYDDLKEQIREENGDSREIFKNYQSFCPDCGAELGPAQTECPYCENDLADENSTYKSNEEKIIEAFDDIDAAKERLAETEELLEMSKANKRRSMILKIMFCFVAIPLVGTIAFAFIGSWLEAREEEKLAEYIDGLASQKVDTIEVEPVDVSGVEFTNTQYRSAHDYVKESDEYIMISLYDAGYDDEQVVSGTVVLEKSGFVDVFTCGPEYVGMNFENGIERVSVDGSGYDERPVDAVYIYDIESVRLDNIQIGDYVFECYRNQWGDYTYVCDLGNNCYFEYEFSPDWDEEVDVKEAFKVKSVDMTVEVNDEITG